MTWTLHASIIHHVTKFLVNVAVKQHVRKKVKQCQFMEYFVLTTFALGQCDSCKNHLKITLSVSDGISSLHFPLASAKENEAATRKQWFFSMHYCDWLENIENSCFLLLKYLFGSFFFLSPWIKFLSFLFSFHCNYILVLLFFFFFFFKNSPFVLCNFKKSHIEKNKKKKVDKCFIYNVSVDSKPKCYTVVSSLAFCDCCTFCVH